MLTNPQHEMERLVIEDYWDQAQQQPFTEATPTLRCVAELARHHPAFDAEVKALNMILEGEKRLLELMLKHFES